MELLITLKKFGFILKIKLVLFFLLTLSLGFHVPSDAYAADGDVTSTVEINSSTTNGPTLTDADYFGWSVANIGDLNNDGVNDIAVGAPYDDEGGTSRGAVHIMFMNTDGSIDSTVEINSSTTNGPTLTNEAIFGWSVANIGDLDGDGVSDIAVGAPVTGGGADGGAIHIVYMNTDGTPKSTVEINEDTANGPTLTNSDSFGSSVANIGDLDGDGVNDIAVGAYGDDEGGSGRGAVHIMYMNTDGSIDSTVEINSSTANGPALDDADYFGWSVADLGDLNNDGVNDIAVGAYGNDNEEGAVHIMYMNTDGSIDSTVEINSSTANGPALDVDDQFGVSVANIGDLDGDGVSDLAVGAPAGGAVAVAAVHIIFMNTDGSIDSTVEINSSTTNGPTITDDDYFGSSVANIGDLDGDLVNDIAVGAYGDDEGGSGRGAVHIISMVGSPVPDKVGTVSTTEGPRYVTLSWSAPSANGNAITDYITQYSTDNSTWSTFADGISTSTTVTVTGLLPVTEYYFQVAAVNSVGTGAFSTSSSTITHVGPGGGNDSCDSNGFGNNNSLRVYRVSYDIETYHVLVNAYSTCGSISAKMTTPTGQSILGLSTDQPFIDDMIIVYSGTLDEHDDKFNISIQNKRDSFSETFYIHDKSITKSYTGDTGYTSEQQGTALPTVATEQTTILPETTIVSEPAVKITPETIDEIKDDSAEKPIVDEKSSIPVGQTAAYTPEPTSPTCGPGTFEKNGICVMDNGSIKTPQESVSGGLENEFIILVIVLGAVAILAIILLAKRKKKSDSENN